MKKKALIFILPFLCLLLSACRSSGAVSRSVLPSFIEPVPTDTPLPTQVPVEKLELSFSAAPVSTVTPMPTATPIPTPVPTPEIQITEGTNVVWSHFADKFTESVVEKSLSYSCSDFAIDILFVQDGSKYTDSRSKLAYFVADIYLKDPQLLRTASAGDSFLDRNTTATVSAMAKRENAVFAASGDFFTCRWTSSFIIRNGELILSHSPKADICVLFKTGELKIFSRGEYTADSLLRDGAWQAWTFGPSLLEKDGSAKKNIRYDLAAKNPRCIIGYYEPGHYCIVVCDGRLKGYSDGIQIDYAAQLMADLGCKVAYNLDGGGSANLYFRNARINRQRLNERPLSDCMYIAYPS